MKKKTVKAWFFSATHNGVGENVIYAGNKTKAKAEEWAAAIRSDGRERTGRIVRLEVPAPPEADCNCNCYNGSQCFNCLNGAHLICRSRPRCSAALAAIKG